MQRSLYIAAYDVTHPRRLRRALTVLKGYACGRQKSVFECYLSDAEIHHLLDQISAVLDARRDRFLLLRHDASSSTRTFGKAITPVDPAWFYIG